MHLFKKTVRQSNNNNITNFFKCTGWDEDRVEQYFRWAYKVVHGLRGTNKQLEDQLDVIFRERNIAYEL